MPDEGRILLPAGSPAAGASEPMFVLAFHTAFVTEGHLRFTLDQVSQVTLPPAVYWACLKEQLLESSAPETPWPGKSKMMLTGRFFSTLFFAPSSVAGLCLQGQAACPLRLLRRRVSPAAPSSSPYPSTYRLLSPATAAGSMEEVLGSLSATPGGCTSHAAAALLHDVRGLREHRLF